MITFKLNDEFVDQYGDRVVPWGFKDAAGNSVGEITFLRTYSRLKVDGSKERWHEVCRRVVEGTFTIQKDHCKTNRLPWNDRKAQASAQDMFERMFTFKWTPPGRGLWMMGTPLVHELKNSAALQNPLRASTRIITRDGVRTLEELAGQAVQVWATGPDRAWWHAGLVSDMGVQSVQTITFTIEGRSSLQCTETATPDHGWVLSDGTKTHALKVGDRVAAGAALTNEMDADYVEGVGSGRAFGDGAVYCSNENNEVHQLPVGELSAGYVAGFIDGWKALDGAMISPTSWGIATQNSDAVQWLIDHATLGGYLATSATVDTFSNNLSIPVYMVHLVRPWQRDWVVTSIDPLADPEQVYCLVVPEVAAFTLASGIVSSNCAFVSTADMTKYNPAEPFAFLMEASMLGVGVGFDTRGAAKDFTIYQPEPSEELIDIADTREGWVESVKILIESYLMPNKPAPVFNYDLIRPAGAPIKTFGGTAAGPGPLRNLHVHVRNLFGARDGQQVTTTDLLDLGNMIGVCVVSGNVRRSAELAIGSIDDKAFLDAKNYGRMVETGDHDGWYNEQGHPAQPATYTPTDAELNAGWELRNAQEWVPGPAAARAEWGWMSNNSVAVNVGDNLTPIVDGIARNGEPGVIWLDQSRKYGRLIDPPNNKDHRVTGYNPCFSGDTIIETVDGPKAIIDITDPTLVYTKGPDGRLSTRKASASFLSRHNAQTLRLEFNNGDHLIVTPEHKLMRRDGTWAEARELQVNDALETLNRTRRGWRYPGVRLGSQPTTEQIMEHRFIWEAVYGGPIPPGYDVDHINRNHNDNRIENLQLLTHSEHSRLSRSQVPNNHQVWVNGKFARAGNHGVKLSKDAIKPPRSTDWINQFTVTSITEGPIIDVYDLTVEETHNLIANGVVAHNCAEQSLESGEMCTLNECYISRHENLDDFKKTLKVAYLYAKTVTLMPTHWPRTNAIMQRNRRIGTSISGIADFADNHGIQRLREWMDQGYQTVRAYDATYSEWLCVRESIKTTTVKPSGTVSILAGVSPGVHWGPGGEFFNRGIIFSADDPIVAQLRAAGYTITESAYTPGSVFIQFPIHSSAKRCERDVTLFEKAALAVEAQRYWSDNSVSVTLTFDPDTEGQHVGTILKMHDGQLKTLSFLPSGNTTYQQMPYQQIDANTYEEAAMTLLRVDLSDIYAGGAKDAAGESMCTTDACEIKQIVLHNEPNLAQPA